MRGNGSFSKYACTPRRDVLPLLLAGPASAKIVKVTERDGFYGAALAQLPNGRLLAGGALNDGRTQHYAVACFSRNGKRDRSFGTNGLAIATPGIGELEDLRALFVQGDGKIVGLGSSVYKGADMGIGIARWTADGRLDPTFDGDGVLVQPVNASAVMDFAEPFRGGFLVGGQTEIPRLDLAPPAWAQGLPGADQIPRELKAFVAGVAGAAWQDHASVPGALDSAYFLDGRESNGGVVFAIGGTYRDAAHKLSLAVGIARLNADGSYDQTFGNGGWNMIEYGPAQGDYALEIGARLVPRPGGGWLIAATGHKAWAFSAWTSQGQPDTSWHGGRLDFNADGSKVGEMFGDMIALPNGSVIAGGSGLYRLLLSRFKPNGALDRTFGRKGRRIVGMAELGMTDIRGISALLPQPRGKIVVLASGRKTPQSEKETLVLLRLNNNGAQDRRFGR